MVHLQNITHKRVHAFIILAGFKPIIQLFEWFNHIQVTISFLQRKCVEVSSSFAADGPSAGFTSYGTPKLSTCTSYVVKSNPQPHTPLHSNI
jgi:hypothetical protein